MEFKAKQQARHFIDYGLMALWLCFASLVSAETDVLSKTGVSRVYDLGG